ncbi:unnamed protein product [Penicillium palitans]
MPDPVSYTVGWICALKVEFVAAQVFLDEKHERPSVVSPNDTNHYELGKMSGHNVVIAVLPDGEYGTASAANVATNMLNTFHNVRIGFMVGIGGGVPSESHDIRLGDVVVSAPRGGQGGVFQYDFGKSIQGQSFQHTRFMNQPPTTLRTAITGIQSQYEIYGHRLEEAVNDIFVKNMRLRLKYGRPDPITDRLFKPEVVHSPKGCAESCSNDASNLITRHERTEHEDNPAIHYGLIASGNQLMKDAMIRDRLAAEKDVLCFEMEAAGLMNTFPCLVVRGICDYSDSHKNKEWQGYAAMVATAYAKDLLYQIPPATVKTEQRISDDRAIVDWLMSPIDYAARQNNYNKRRQPGTGQEFLTSEEFQVWLQSEKQTLYCPGIPGAGKTMITSIVIDHISSRFQTELDTCIAYLYFEYARRDEQNLENLLESLLKQLAQQLFEHTESLPKGLKELYANHTPRKSRPTIYELLKILENVVSSDRRTFIVVDALDECQNDNGCRSKFVAHIFELQDKGRLNFFATSRPHVVETPFKICISREIRATKDDIYTYVDEQVSQWELSRKDTISDHLRADIKRQVDAAAEGMFLLAYLNMMVLKEQNSRRDIKDALHNLSKGERELKKAYDQMMERIKKGHLYAQILAWIFFAKRPLTTKELQHALAIRSHDTHLDEEGIPSVQTILSACAGFVRLDETSDIFDFAHGTVREYFEQTKIGWLVEAEKDLAAKVVTYISFDTFASGFSPKLSDFKHRCQLNPFFHYAAKNWGHHVRQSSLQRERLVIDFLEHDGKVSASYEGMAVQPTATMDFGFGLERKIKGMHLAAGFGLSESIVILRERQHDLNATDTDRRTPLMWAVLREQHAAVELLLELGADPESSDRHGWTPLLFAVGTDRMASLALLVRNGAKVDCSDQHGQTALLWAVTNRNEAAVKLLLDNDADIESKDQYGQSPLYIALTCNNLSIIWLLLDGGASTESRNKNGQTPLSWAAGKGKDFTSSVKLLLDYEANIESEDHSGQTPLSRAAENGNDAVIELLVAAGADYESKDRCYAQTPLSWASEKGQTAAAKLLLEKGADIESKDIFGRTPLSCASESGNLDTVNMLLRNGADPQSKDEKHGQTPLSWAAEKGHPGVVESLLDWGADPESSDDQGWTPLSLATWHKNSSVVECLLKKGADIESEDQYGRTPLSWAAEIGHEGIVRLLREKGGDIESHDDYGQTPLSWAAENGNERVVRLLLDMGANPNFGDVYGRTPVSLATENQHVAVVNLLMNHHG